MSEDQKKLAIEDIKERIKQELYLKNKEKGILDAMQEKLVSRKLLVFMTATGMALTGNLESDLWAVIAGVYVFGLVILDSIKEWKGLL